MKQDIENLQSQITQNLENIVDNVSGSINNLQSNINGLENNINEKLETDNLVKSLNIIPVNDEWTQLGQTVNGNLKSGYFGYPLAFSGDGNIFATAIDDYSDKIGSIKTYKFNGFNWIKLGQDIVELDENDSFRNVHLSANGEILAYSSVYNTGIARVFKYNNEEDEWKQIGQNIVGENEDDVIGLSSSLSFDGKLLAISNKNNKVSVYSFDKNKNLWIHFGQELLGTENDILYGYTCSLSGDGKTLSIMTKNSNEGSFIEIFKYNDEEHLWKRIGQKILAKTYNTLSIGYNLTLSFNGKILSAGSCFCPYEERDFTLKGIVFNYDENNNIWHQIGQTFEDDLLDPVLNPMDSIRTKLLSDGNFMTVSILNFNPEFKSKVNVYRYESSLNLWVLIGQEFKNTNSYYGYYSYLSIDNTRLIISNDEINNGEGEITVYKNDLLALPKNTLYSLPDSTIKIKHYDNTKYERNEDGLIVFLN